MKKSLLSIEEVKGLTVLELSELVHALEEVFGVSAAAAAVAGSRCRCRSRWKKRRPSLTWS